MNFINISRGTETETLPKPETAHEKSLAPRVAGCISVFYVAPDRMRRVTRRSNGLELSAGFLY